MKKTYLILSMFLTTLFLMSSCTKNNTGEGPEGNEGGIQWPIAQASDVTAAGLRLMLTYDPATSTFSGTLENTNATAVSMTRIEVHVVDAANISTEFGPTPAVDMQPGAIRNISLAITPGLNPVTYSIHPEFGVPGTGS